MNKETDWIKLENAATIYPATITRKFAALFRLTITLKVKIPCNDMILFFRNKPTSNEVSDSFFKYAKKLGLYHIKRKHIILVVQMKMII